MVIMYRSTYGTKCLWYKMAMVRNGYGTKMIFTMVRNGMYEMVMVRNDCNSYVRGYLQGSENGRVVTIDGTKLQFCGTK